MSKVTYRLRRAAPAVVVLLVLGCLYGVSQASVAVGESAASVATPYRFAELPIPMPPGYATQPMSTVRKVNPAYQHIAAWISSVGASIAINDLSGGGLPDGMCIVDTRTNQVVVTYTPTAAPKDRFTPFALDAAPLPMDDTMAPTGCTPGDFNGDGRMDLLVTYWGRTPILFLATPRVGALSSSGYRPRELVAGASPDGRYHGPRWNTDAAYVADLDGDGHPDIVVGNYFPDSDVLDPNGQHNVVMNSSLSRAENGGGDRVLRWVSSTSGAAPGAHYVEDEGAIPFTASSGWTLALSGADLTGDGLPDVYVANDFGHDHLLYNRSVAGRIRFTEAIGTRTATTPKSFRLGKGSFKGMGVDFGDLDGAGKFDIAVSNITTSWGLQESNFLWHNDAGSEADMAQELTKGHAPFTQQAEQRGVAWTGWSWDVKMGDFLNSGTQDIVQTDGFVKGNIDRWPWLQEMAMTNDDLLSDPAMWPNVGPGDDIAGHQSLAFYARTSSGKYVDISKQLGMAVATPTRGLATADTTGTGRLDVAVARQWGPPVFYANKSSVGNFVELNLYRPGAGSAQGGGAPTPAYDASVRVTSAGGTQVAQLDGGGGHGGFRSFQVHVGLGAATGPVSAEISWRDSAGGAHRQTMSLTTGSHTLMLTDTIQELTS